MKVLLILAAIIISPASLVAQSSVPATHQTHTDCSSSVICPDEELVYEVSWMKIPLGQIKLKTLESKMTETGVEHNVSAYIDSYSGLPFVDLHAIDHSHMDETFYSKGFDAIEKKGDQWISEKSRCDVQQKLLVVEKTIQADKNSAPSGPSTFDTLRLKSVPIQDGLSILYFARANIRSGREIRVPTVVYGKQGMTRFHFQATTDFEEIEAVKDKKIRVILLEGNAEFEGIFGFTGDFKGWFSDDAAAIPIKAELSVLVGTVKIELTQWNRRAWIMPR